MDIGYAGALIGGMLTLLSPCSVMLLPAFFAYAFAKPSELLARTGLFYLGLVTTLVPLGVLAGTVGVFVTQNRTAFVGVASLLVVLMGVIQISGLRFPAFTRGSAAEGTSAFSVYLLGAVYGVAGVCAGPILGSVLTVAALGSNAVYGGVLLAIYALGMAAPLIVLALLWDRFSLGKSRLLRPQTVRIGKWENSRLMIVSGALSIAIGIFLFVTDGTASLGGVLTIGDQFAAESWVLDVSSLVTNLGFGIAAIGVLAVVALAFWVRNSRTRRRTLQSQE